MRRLAHLLGDRDTLAGLAVMAVCAMAWRLTAGFDEVPAMLSQNVPPTFFPRLVIGAAALLGAILMAGGLRRRAGGMAGGLRRRAGNMAAGFRRRASSMADRGAAGDLPASTEEAGGAAPPPPVFWATAGLVAAAGLLIPLLGTLPTLGLVAIGLPLLWGERRFRLVAALALGLPGAIYAVFTLALGVRFPAGLIWNLL